MQSLFQKLDYDILESNELDEDGVLSFDEFMPWCAAHAPIPCTARLSFSQNAFVLAM